MQSSSTDLSCCMQAHQDGAWGPAVSYGATLDLSKYCKPELQAKDRALFELHGLIYLKDNGNGDFAYVTIVRDSFKSELWIENFRGVHSCISPEDVLSHANSFVYLAYISANPHAR